MKTKNTLLTLGLIGVLGITGCNKGVNSGTVSEKDNITTIHLGVSGAYRESNTQVLGIRYDGMPNDKTFSISTPNSRVALNTFYPASSEKINFNNREYNIIKVTPDSLVASTNYNK